MPCIHRVGKMRGKGECESKGGGEKGPHIPAPSYSPFTTVSYRNSKPTSNREGKLTRQCGVQVDNLDPRLLKRLQERRREDVHPPRQHHQLGPLLHGQHPLGQRRVVRAPRLGHLFRVRLALAEEAAADEVDVLPGDAFFWGGQCQLTRGLKVGVVGWVRCSCSWGG